MFALVKYFNKITMYWFKSPTLMHLLFVLFKKDLNWDHALLLTGLDLYARYKQILNLCLRIR